MKADKGGGRMISLVQIADEIDVSIRESTSICIGYVLELKR